MPYLDSAGEPRCDLLNQPRVTVWVIEGEERPVARALGVGTGEPCPRGKWHAVPHLTRVDATADKFKAGASMHVAYELENALSMINFVAMGCGCSLLPEYACAIRHDGVAYRPLRSPKLAKTLAIIKKKGRRGLAETFFRFTVEKLAESR